MVFAGLSFLYCFLPAVLIVYYAVPCFLKNYVLLVASLVFYYIGEQRLVWVMITSILLNYGAGLLIQRFRSRRCAKVILGIAVASDLVILCYYKYTDFFISSFNSLFSASAPLLHIALPIGISFYTFQAMSYTIDVYCGDMCAAKNPCSVATYITLFPQLIAGPIVRYSDIEKELGNRKCTINDFSHGISRFCIGLGKKVLLANSLSSLVKVAAYMDEKTVVLSWMSAVAFALQIYFDFSGYSDMAIGLCKMFGFHISENFNYPYISTSITDFWRRWHISLGTFFRDYVYIPLGGNRVPKWRWLINIAVVWFLTGLWHGAEWHFAVWGAMFGVLLIWEKVFLRKLLKKLPSGFGIVYTMFFVVVGFVIFSSDDMLDAVYNLKAMFGFSQIPLVEAETLYLLRSYAVTFVVAVIAATPLVTNIARKFKKKPFSAIIEPAYACMLLLLSTAYLVDGSFNPFLYFRF